MYSLDLVLMLHGLDFGRKKTRVGQKQREVPCGVSVTVVVVEYEVVY